MKQKITIVILIFFLVSVSLYSQEKKEIAGIQEIVEVRKNIVIPKDPVISALLAVQYPGLGQVYCGKYWRAAGIFLGEVTLIAAGVTLRGEKQEKFTYAVIDSATGETVYLEGKKTVTTEKTDQEKMFGNLLLLSAVSMHIWQIFDAYHQANVHNRDMIRRTRKETGFNLKLKENGIGLTFYKNF